MSELADIILFYDRVSKKRMRSALATVISTEGPSYRSPGSRSIICQDGTFKGGLSAGCLEGDVGCRLDGAVEPFVVDYDLSTADVVRGFPFGCGGKVRILVEPLPNAGALSAVSWLAALNEPAVLLTIVRSADQAVVPGTRFGMDASAISKFDGGLVFEGMEQLCLSILTEKKSKSLEVATPDLNISVFAEYVEPAISVFIYGDGEDARILETLASRLEMNVESVPRKRLRCGETLAGEYPRLGHAYHVVMTHDLDLDTLALSQILAVSPPYLGVLGPRSRTDRMLAALLEQAPDQRVRSTIHRAQLYSPVGLNMGAETPGEIALSILAEIQTVARGRKPAHLRDLPGAIHERSESGKNSQRSKRASDFLL